MSDFTQLPIAKPTSFAGAITINLSKIYKVAKQSTNYYSF